jgi:hypothetical protein
VSPGRPLQFSGIDIVGDILDIQQLNLGSEKRPAPTSMIRCTLRMRTRSAGTSLRRQGPLAVARLCQNFDAIAQREKAVFAARRRQMRPCIAAKVARRLQGLPQIKKLQKITIAFLEFRSMDFGYSFDRAALKPDMRHAE